MCITKKAQPCEWRACGEKLNYFLSSFLGLHFSQVFLALAASTQHLWSHSLPAFLALSQQLSARALNGVASSARVQAIIVNILMLFISVLYLLCVLQDIAGGSDEHPAPPGAWLPKLFQ